MLKKIAKATKKELSTSVLTLRSVIIALSAGIVTYLLLNSLQPFGIENYTADDKSIKLLLSAVAATGAILFTDLVLPLLLTNYFNRSTWTVSKQITQVFVRFIAAGLSVMIYVSQSGLGTPDMALVLVVLAGIAAVWGLVYALSKEKSLHQKYASSAEEITERLKNHTPSESLNPVLPVMHFEGISENVNIVPNQLVAVKIGAKSSTFTIQNLLGTTSRELAIDKNVVLSEMAKHSHFLEIDKNFFVNEHAIYKTEGSAKGYEVYVAKTDKPVLLSKKYEKVLKSI